MSFLPDSTLDHLRLVVEQPDLSNTRYRIEREIGRGGMGVVYQAWDAVLERPVALKVVEGPPVEATTLAQLEHPGLVPVYDAGKLPDGRGYYAMRLVRGRRFDEFLRDEASLPARLRMFHKVCEAVAFAHDRGVVHCDLKPQNLMTGGYGEVFVMDWGIAGSSGDAARAGTPPYMAPEKTIDQRADIFALGRILDDLLPHPAPRALAAIRDRAFAADRTARYASAELLAADINRFLDGLPVTAYRETWPERLLRFASRNQVLLLLLGSYMFVKFAIFFWSLR
jgi:serine/threonine protein kinase